jgi:Phage integrase, N-terminal SAM-like domain
MAGHIRRRGERSWELKFDIGTDPTTGQRRSRYHSFKGTKRDAEAELVRLKASANRGDYVDASKVRLGDFLDRWEAWAATQVSAKTLERYAELLRHHVRPHLGDARIQRLRTVDFAALYGTLQQAKPAGAGLAPRHCRPRAPTAASGIRPCRQVERHHNESSRGGRAAPGGAPRDQDPQPGGDQVCARGIAHASAAVRPKRESTKPSPLPNRARWPRDWAATRRDRGIALGRPRHGCRQAPGRALA